MGTTVAGGTDLLCFIYPTLPQVTRWAQPRTNGLHSQSDLDRELIQPTPTECTRSGKRVRLYGISPAIWTSVSLTSNSYMSFIGKYTKRLSAGTTP